MFELVLAIYLAFAIISELSFKVVGGRAEFSIAEYAFSRPQCLLSDFLDISTYRIGTGSLKQSPAKKSPQEKGCTDGIGYRPLSAQSFLYSSRKLALGSGPFAIELWMRVSQTHNQRQTLLFIDPPFGRACASQFQIIQERSDHSSLYYEFTVSFCNNQKLVTLEQDSYFRVLKNTSKIIHMVINVNFERAGSLYIINLDCYFNGGKTNSSAVIASSYLVDASGWNSNSILYLFANPGGNPDEITAAPTRTPTATPTAAPSARPSTRPAIATPRPSTLQPSSTFKPTVKPTAAAPTAPTPSFWNGTIYYFTLYNRSLSIAEISSNFISALPNSMPIPTSRSVIVQQDGEQGDHSNDPAFYQRRIPNNELAFVSLFGADFDNNPYSPNYIVQEEAGRLQPIKLLALSATDTSGHFYFANGTIIDSSSLPVVIYPEIVTVIAPDSTITSSLLTGIRYRPPKGRFNEVEGSTSDGVGIALQGPQIATIVFTLRDQTIKEWAVENGTVKVFVAHVDRPPMVDISSIQEAMAHTMAPLIISGSDSDSLIKTVKVISLPRHGSLFIRNGVHSQWLKLNSSDKGGASTSSAHTFSYPADISYMYSSLEPMIPLYNNKSVIEFDDFLVSLGDEEGRYSVEANYSIGIVPAIVAIPYILNLGVTNAIENTCSLIIMNGADRSMRPSMDMKADYSFVVKLLPRYGSLYTSPNCDDDDASSNIVVDQVIHPTGPDEENFLANIYFKGIPHYFSYPHISANQLSIAQHQDFFSYVVEKNDKSAMSVASRQYINICDINDATIVSNPKWSNANIEVEAVGSTNIDVFLVDGFQILDNDRDVDVILVQIRAQFGYMYLPKTIILDVYKAYENTLCGQEGRYICYATPDIYNGFNSISFITTPSAALKLLNNIGYKSLRANVRDTLTVSIYDGVTGNCLSKKVQNKAIIRQNKCYNSSVSIVIDVGDHAGANGITSGSQGTSSYLLTTINLLAIVAGLFVVFALSKALYVNTRCGEKAGFRNGSSLEVISSNLSKMLLKSRRRASSSSSPSSPSPSSSSSSSKPVPSRTYSMYEPADESPRRISRAGGSSFIIIQQQQQQQMATAAATTNMATARLPRPGSTGGKRSASGILEFNNNNAPTGNQNGKSAAYYGLEKTVRRNNNTISSVNSNNTANSGYRRSPSSTGRRSSSSSYVIEGAYKVGNSKDTQELAISSSSSLMTTATIAVAETTAARSRGSTSRRSVGKFSTAVPDPDSSSNTMILNKVTLTQQSTKKAEREGREKGGGGGRGGVAGAVEEDQEVERNKAYIQRLQARTEKEKKEQGRQKSAGGGADSHQTDFNFV